MTTPEPRVRVDRTHMREWFTWRCPCGTTDLVMGHLDATDAAHRHAAICPALRLARLLRELETLRDTWIETATAERRDVYTAMDPYGTIGHANGIDYAAADLTAILDRAEVLHA